MKKIQIFLLLIIVMTIVAIFYKGIAIAAEVSRIHSSRKYIFINGTIADGFVLGAKVCFYSSSGEEITCGIIDQASESFSKVRVNNRIAKQIDYGMEARLSVEKDSQEEATGPQECTDDSECGDDGYCVNGKCIKSEEQKNCVDDSQCGDVGYCINGKCIKKKDKKRCVDDSECGDSGVCINGKCY